jgi:hypothetical protein
MQGWIGEALLLGRFLSPFVKKIEGFIAAILVYVQFAYH